MRRLWISVLCLVGVCAVAPAASSAAGGPPEIGHCLKVKVIKTGAYSNSVCTSLNKKHLGEYEWTAGPGAKKGFTGSIKGALLETTKAEKIGCAAVTFTGEYTGAKTLKTSKTTWTGCENQTHHSSCATNPVKSAGIIEGEPMVGELGKIPGSKSELAPYIGWDFKPENTSLPIATFVCGEAKGQINYMMEGSVIARVKLTSKSVPSFELTFKQVAGVQVPTAFIGGAEDTLKLVESPFPFAEKTTVQVGLGGPGKLEDEEEYEIKGK